ncbi:MAG: Mov34/MPN/PAD-1 family protein [Sciscionella sp.]
MLRLPRACYHAIVTHAREEHPLEVCGVVAGPRGTHRPTRWVPLVNAAHSATRYEVSSVDLLALYRDLDARGEELVVVYHSHPSSPPYPSDTDITLASEPAAHYVVVSPRAGGDRGGIGASQDVEVRSFRIVDGAVREEPLEVSANG